jgi:hypothetical protein
MCLVQGLYDSPIPLTLICGFDREESTLNEVIWPPSVWQPSDLLLSCPVVPVQVLIVLWFTAEVICVYHSEA